MGVSQHQREGAHLPRAVQDIDYAIINDNYVVSSGMKIAIALARETSKDHVNWAVVRTEDVGKPFAAKYHYRTLFDRFLNDDFLGLEEGCKDQPFNGCA